MRVHGFSVKVAPRAKSTASAERAGLLDVLTTLPAQLRLSLPSGATVLGVHASPRADDGPGIAPGIPDEQLRQLLAGADADVFVAGATRNAEFVSSLLTGQRPFVTAGDRPPG